MCLEVINVLFGSECMCSKAGVGGNLCLLMSLTGSLGLVAYNASLLLQALPYQYTFLTYIKIAFSPNGHAFSLLVWSIRIN